MSLGLILAVLQTGALAMAADLTGSSAMKTQTITSVVDVVVAVFLLLGVIRSDRPADAQHPLGYGREGFFWSFVAAAGIFVGGVGAAAAETVQSVLRPEPTGSYVVGYAVLGVVTVLDLAGLAASMKPLLARARQRGVNLIAYLWRGTDPALTTVCLSSLAGLMGGAIAATGLAARQITGQSVADGAASAVIGLVLLVTSLLLLHTSRELLTGRGVAPDVLNAMRLTVGREPGIIEVPDIFAIVVGPGMLVVDGDVVFDDSFSVSRVESAIVDVAAALRAAWPSIVYVYLNPVAAHRERRIGASSTSRPSHWAGAVPANRPDIVDDRPCRRRDSSFDL